MIPRIAGAISALALLAAHPALAQRTPAYQDGTVSAGDALKAITQGRYGKTGGLSGDANGLGLNPHSTTDNNGLGECFNNVKTGLPHNALCLGHNPDGNGLITLDSYGGLEAKELKFRINGTEYTFPSEVAVVGSDVAVANNAALKVLQGSLGKRAVRLGFTTAGDGGKAEYNWSASNCSAADDGAQVQPTGITGCWVADFSGVVPSPKVWGAIGDGATNDTTKVQAAITAMYDGRLYVGDGRYCIGSPGLRAVRPIHISGANPHNQYAPTARKYGLIACATNLNILTFAKDGSDASNGSTVTDLFIDAGAAGANASGSALRNEDTSWIEMDRLRIVKACIGLDERSSNSNRLANSLITSEGASLASGCGGVRVGQDTTDGNTVDFRFVDNTVDVRADYSVLIKDAGGMFMRGNDLLFAVNGTIIRPGSGQHVKWLYADNSALSDSTCSDGLIVDTSAADAQVTGLSFVQTWTASAGNNPGGSCLGAGAVIRNTGGGNVDGVHFNGHRSYSNGAEGVVVKEDVKNVTFDNGMVCANSAAKINVPATTYDGFSIDTNASGVAVRNNRIGADCIEAGAFEGLQGTGIFLHGGNEDITITGNDLRDNASAGLGGTAPTGESVIAINAGADNVIIDIAGAATITAPLQPLIAITGSGATITTVNGMWDGREVKLYMVDGGNDFATGGNVCNAKSFSQFETATLTRIPGASCSSVK